jgi:hypothetical protein
MQVDRPPRSLAVSSLLPRDTTPKMSLISESPVRNKLRNVKRTLRGFAHHASMSRVEFALESSDRVDELMAEPTRVLSESAARVYVLKFQFLCLLFNSPSHFVVPTYPHPARLIFEFLTGRMISSSPPPSVFPSYISRTKWYY